MKITCVLIVVLAAIAFVAADSGFYSPGAFFKLDAGGNRGKVHYISPNIQKRLRRQVFGGSSSASSSVSSGPGGSFFTQSGSTYQTPDLGSRFDTDTPVNGVYHTSSGYIDNNGQVHYTNNQGGPLYG